MKKRSWLLSALTAITLVLFISCNSSSSSTKPADTAIDTALVIKEDPAATDTDDMKWEMEESKDEMDGSTTYFASISSVNTETFEFPYGESSFKLWVRKSKGSTDVYITCGKCQFLTGISGDKYYRVKFDDEKPFTVSASSASSGSADVAFLGSASTLIKKLRTAKRFKVEAEFYDAGYRTIEFKTEGFQWNH